MTWTKLADMNSGGWQKEPFAYIWIEAREEEASKVFYNRFGHNPYRVTCICCGEDYSVYEYESLEEATVFERGCTHDENQSLEKSQNNYMTLDELLECKVLPNGGGAVEFIFASDIMPSELEGDLPDEQGYVLKFNKNYIEVNKTHSIKRKNMKVFIKPVPTKFVEIDGACLRLDDLQECVEALEYADGFFGAVVIYCPTMAKVLVDMGVASQKASGSYFCADEVKRKALCDELSNLAWPEEAA